MEIIPPSIRGDYLNINCFYILSEVQWTVLSNDTLVITYPNEAGLRGSSGPPNILPPRS